MTELVIHSYCIGPNVGFGGSLALRMEYDLYQHLAAMFDRDNAPLDSTIIIVKVAQKARDEEYVFLNAHIVIGDNEGGRVEELTSAPNHHLTTTPAGLQEDCARLVRAVHHQTMGVDKWDWNHELSTR